MHVGPQHLRQYPAIPLIPTDGERGRAHSRARWRLNHQGHPTAGYLAVVGQPDHGLICGARASD